MLKSIYDWWRTMKRTTTLPNIEMSSQLRGKTIASEVNI